MAAGMQGERQENGGTGQLKDSGAAWDTRPQVGGRKRAVFFGGSSAPSDYGTKSGETG